MSKRIRDLQVETVSVSALQPYGRNPRTHSTKQLRQIAASIKQFGFVNPVLTDAGGRIIAGHGRVEAAKLLGMGQVPTIRLEDLTEAQIRAYIIADNRLAELAGWDEEILAIELQFLSELDLFHHFAEYAALVRRVRLRPRRQHKKAKFHPCLKLRSNRIRPAAAKGHRVLNLSESPYSNPWSKGQQGRRSGRLPLALTGLGL